MRLHEPHTPLRLDRIPVPQPKVEELLVKVLACAVCRTDLHIVDGELTEPRLPLVPGHEIVGEVVELGPGASRFDVGDRVGIPWLRWTCGECEYCKRGRENLCVRPRLTGYTADGGYAEYCVADERYCLPLPEEYEPAEATPLLCAGLIGYRSLKKAGDAQTLGIYGFGAAGHIVTQVAVWQGRRVFAFTRPGDGSGQEFARGLGASWAGGSDETSPEELDAAIIFAPVGALVPAALRGVRRGGTVVCGGIHMSDIPSFPYELLWGERTVTSVANLTRADGEEFLRLAPMVPVRLITETFPLAEANEALERLRDGRLAGAAVLVP
jgi:propanol-preferring alcohol dehydrogenase